MLNIGIVGTGNIATNVYGPLFKDIPDIQLWSVLSRQFKNAQDYATTFNAAAPNPIFTDLNSFFKDPLLDAVIICVTDKLHYKYIKHAVENNIHVMCEKPIVHDEFHLNLLEQLLNDSPIVLSTCLQHRWHNGISLLRNKILAQHVLGKVHHMRVSWRNNIHDKNNWRASSKTNNMWSTAAMGPHCFDLVRWFMSPIHGEPKIIRNIHGSPFWNADNDEISSTLIGYSSGAIAEVFTSVLGQPNSSIEIIGSEGHVTATDVLGAHGQGSILINDEELNFEPQNPFKGLMNNFIDSISKNKVPECNIKVASENVRDLFRAFNL